MESPCSAGSTRVILNPEWRYGSRSYSNLPCREGVSPPVCHSHCHSGHSPRIIKRSSMHTHTRNPPHHQSGIESLICHACHKLHATLSLGELLQSSEDNDFFPNQLELSVKNALCARGSRKRDGCDMRHQSSKKNADVTRDCVCKAGTTD